MKLFRATVLIAFIVSISALAACGGSVNISAPISTLLAMALKNVGENRGTQQFTFREVDTDRKAVIQTKSAVPVGKLFGRRV